MSARPNLRAVAEGERPRKPRRKTIVQAAATGTTHELLTALRARLAKAVQDPKTPPRDLAALSRRLVEVVHEIETIDARDQGETAHPDAGTDEQFDASAV